MNRKSILLGKIFAIALIFVLIATAAPIVSASNGSDVSGVSSQWKVEEGGNPSEGALGEKYNFVTKWAVADIVEDVAFWGPRGIAVDGSGNVYVVDTDNNRTQKFDSNGNFITKWGSYGTGDGEFQRPRGIAVDNGGNVFVADTRNDRIQKFDSNGNFITKWGSYGTGDGEFYEPAGIAVDNSGNVFVADIDHDRIQKFDSNGNFITNWGSDDGSHYNIAVDSSGNVFVADSIYLQIQKFDSNGNFITNWGGGMVLVMVSLSGLWA
ncbi:MAG: Virginiamycin B lyase [Candidatus Methanophagaceae archaeon]|nr:MAG: Virginiamycin B lyase [Methanophagales archaeon]